MPRTSIDDQIQAKIESFVSELTTLVREAAIESVSDALGSGQAPRRAKSSNGRKAKSKAPRKAGGRVRRSAADLEGMMATVLAHVQANDGDRLEEISRALKIASSELKRPVAMLLEGKKLRTTGQRRGTKYHAKAGGARKPGKETASKKRGKRAAKKAA